MYLFYCLYLLTLFYRPFKLDDCVLSRYSTSKHRYWSTLAAKILWCWLLRSTILRLTLASWRVLCVLICRASLAELSRAACRSHDARVLCVFRLTWLSFKWQSMAALLAHLFDHIKNTQTLFIFCAVGKIQPMHQSIILHLWKQT